MNILLVEDDGDVRETVADTLRRSDHAVTEAADGLEAFDRFKEREFHVVVSDWAMPRLDGVALCRMLRALARDNYPYIIMVTAISGAERMIEALDAGADDFITKPIDRSMLAARLRVAQRILNLRAHATCLEGLLAICSSCKCIRTDDGSWVQVERYVQDRSALRFSHGMCPSCIEEHYSEYAQKRPAAKGPAVR